MFPACAGMNRKPKTWMAESESVPRTRGAVGDYVVTSGQFSDEAKDFASGRNIELINGGELNALIQRVVRDGP